MYEIIQAPMAGGNATPALAHAVGEAGGLGYLAAGYKTIERLKEEIHSLRALGTDYFGVNLFVPAKPNNRTPSIEHYCAQLLSEAELIETTIGDYRFSDDSWHAKVQLMIDEQVPVVSFTFHLPTADVITSMKKAGIKTVQTVTSIDEARQAEAQGVDEVCVQGVEAGGHRAAFDDSDPVDAKPLVALVKEVVAAVQIPVVAAGGIMDGAGIRAVLDAGAHAAQLGTAFLCCPESGTNPTHIKALLSGKFTTTAYTRAYTGRLARGLNNDFMMRYPDAPQAFPEMHYVTQPLRKKAAELDRADLLAMWTGQNFSAIRVMPATELVHVLKKEANLL